jgi:ubiquinone/menaquinone biosynthesis C-methylase UbiE
MENRKTFFDRHAANWDEDLRYGEKGAQLAEMVSMFQLADGMSVLDVGTGTGVLLPFLAEAIGSKGRVLAMDFSFKMLEKAKLRPTPATSYLLNASVEAIPLPSGYFDCVTCFAAFPHFPDKLKALSEMVRVLKNGGYILIAHLHSAEELNRFHQGVGGAVGHDHLPHPERLRGSMQLSGLKEISIMNQHGKFLAKGQKG